MLDKKIVETYNRSRKGVDTSKVCHAPFVNLNFEQNGHVTSCCFNRTDVLGVYPKQSVMEIWNGIAAQQMRNKISQLNLDGGCRLCEILIESGNFSGTKAKHYDEYSPIDIFKPIKNIFQQDSYKWPKVFEFEMSNTCNLACEMCSGYYSSTIRKNIEKLPPIYNPYDDAFVEQLAPFLPHLKDMKFLGGEPFLIDIYYKIWEKVVEIHPKIRIHITTNGTVYNQRVRTLLNKMNVGIIVSIDSLNNERYAQIRKGSQLEKVLNNVQSFKEIIQKNKTYLSIATCLMNNNWMDMPDILRFCNQEGFHLHYNIVWNPEKLSLRFMNYYQLDEIIDFFNQQNFEISTTLQRQNYSVYQEMVRTVEHWKNERSHTLLQEVSSEKVYRLNHNSCTQINIPKNLEELSRVLLIHFSKNKPYILEELDKLLPQLSLKEKGDVEVFPFLEHIYKQYGASETLRMYFQFLPIGIELFYDTIDQKTLIQKTNIMMNRILALPQIEKVVEDMLQETDKRSFIYILDMLNVNEVDMLMRHIEISYPVDL